MSNDVWDYFCVKYKNARFTVVPGHWPDFKSKEEVDEWIESSNSMNGFIEKLLKKGG